MWEGPVLVQQNMNARLPLVNWSEIYTCLQGTRRRESAKHEWSLRTTGPEIATSGAFEPEGTGSGSQVTGLGSKGAEKGAMRGGSPSGRRGLCFPISPLV